MFLISIMIKTDFLTTINCNGILIRLCTLPFLFSFSCSPNNESANKSEKSPSSVVQLRNEMSGQLSKPVLFKQDLNKSYGQIKRPWVLAKPLVLDGDLNESEFLNE
jgi:hypothetical protein